MSQAPSFETDLLNKMQQAMLHRGPDGEGIYLSEHIGLGMRRLSIIDLKNGWQPLYNEDRSLVLIANGEIYNYVELRQGLISRGHQFSTGSDCETILHLYEEHDVNCLRYLRGMFAFALWDTHKQRLFLARDRMGEKPLYLYEKDNELVFASEMKALLANPQIHFELDPESVDNYFHYQYVPEPQTLIKGVQKLPAGHYLLIEMTPWKISEECYWKISAAEPVEGDPATLIRAELETISSQIIRSDVPVGIALSGGLDSSALAALAVQKYPGTLQAFSIGYPGRPGNDERLQACQTAKRLRIPFHELEVTTEEVVSFFPELVYWRDDPIADIAGHNYFAVMEMAREHKVPVMLQGQGADELFWGYSHVRQAAFQSEQKAALWKKSWGALASYLTPQLPEQWNRRGVKRWARSGAGVLSGWHRFMEQRNSPMDRLIFFDLSQGFCDAQKYTRQIYTEEFLQTLQDHSATDLFTFPQPWGRTDVMLTELICNTYLLENGIAQGDRLSMASSVELRLPLVDYRLVELVIGLRKNNPDHTLGPKTWLKRAVKDLLPAETINQKKRGFEPPVIEWMTALLKVYGHQLKDGFLVAHNIIDPKSAVELAHGHLSGVPCLEFAYQALVLEVWCRRFS